MEDRPVHETLDSPLRFRHWMQSDGLSAQYDFFFIKTPDGLVEAPEIKSKRTSARAELERFAGKRMEDIEGVKFTVIFDPVRRGANLENPTNLRLSSDRVVEMHLARQDCAPIIQRVGGYIYWNPVGQPRHDDAGDFAPGDAMRVFSTLASIAEKYVETHKPDGIIIGTDEKAKDGRARIYQRMIGRLLKGRGRVYTGEELGGEAREGMRNTRLVWLAQGEPLQDGE